MSVLTSPAPRPASPANPPGPPKLSPGGLRRAQAETLRTPRFRYSIPARLLCHERGRRRARVWARC